MAWPDDLYPASFRGVPFEVEGSDTELARRHELHEFPGRDGGVVEEFGRSPDRLSLEAFVVGDDWLERKRLLAEACTQRGSGTLVHPWWGAFSAFCTSCTVRESSRDGGIVTFQLEFLRVADVPFVYQRTPPASAVEQQASAVGLAAEQDTATNVVATGVPDYVRAATSNGIAELGQRLRELDVFSGPATDAAVLLAEVSDLIASASFLSTSPVLAAARVKSAIERVFDAAGNALSALYAYETLFSLSASELGSESALGVARDSNARLIAAQARHTAFAGAARAAAAIKWASYDDALAARARIVEPLDLELELVTPRQYEALAKLRAAVVAALPPPERDLPRLRRIELGAVTSSLELAYALYDDSERAGEIVERNRPPYPGRLPAASLVEVLSR